MPAERAACVSYRVHSTPSAPEAFTPEETAALAPYFGNVDQPIFALTNLPEVVKGALFARYSRSAKSVRRLFLDEFLDALGGRGAEADGASAARASRDTAGGPGQERADRLYRRVVDEYGDDSVTQVGGAHIACEGVSNVLTKVLERGRLMAYIEQSTRFVPYTDRPGGAWKYVTPPEIEDEVDRARFRAALDRAFETYARWIEPLQTYYRARHPRGATDSEPVYRSAIRAKALDTLRGLLPAATRSNVGIYGSGQAYEALLLRMRAHPLAESSEVARLMLAELNKVIPAFLRRVDRKDRGVAWTHYLRARNEETHALVAEVARLARHPGGIDNEGDAADPACTVGLPGASTGTPTGGTSTGVADRHADVTLADFDPDGEIKVVAAALYPDSCLPMDHLLAVAREMTTGERARVLRTYAGDRKNRGNRRHRPGRAFEHATYAFDIVSDYGAFRDLQRHRMLTLDWQGLTTRHGYAAPPEAVEEVGALSDWRRVMDDSAELYERLARRCSPAVAQYAVSMAYRIRFYMRMNAREAMHVIELRTSPQGHPAYRRVCQRMHRLIAEEAGHTAIAAAMAFADHSDVELERLASERALDKKRAARHADAGKDGPEDPGSAS